MNFPLPLRMSALATITVATVALTGCASPTTAETPADSSLQVVTTTTQLTDFAEHVGGADAQITGLLPTGASAHHFDPSPADLLALGRADLLVVNGAELESFVDDAIEASGFSGTIITAADGIDLELAREITLEGSEAEAGHHDHEHDEHDHDEHDHAGEPDHASHDHDADQVGEPAANDSDHDHDHGDLNPHIWTSPRFALGMVAEIAEGFAAADPEHAAGYEARAAEYAAQLTALDTWITAQYERVPAADRVLVSGHDSLRYYLHDYGITFAGAILPSFEDNAEPSAAQIDALVDSIREAGVPAIFVESSMSPKLAQTIAKEAGIHVVDAANLYADSLGAPGTGADSYVSATVLNTQTILNAWGVTPDALPESLQ